MKKFKAPQLPFMITTLFGLLFNMSVFAMNAPTTLYNPLKEILINGTVLKLEIEKAIANQEFDYIVTYRINNPSDLHPNIICALFTLHLYQNPYRQKEILINANYVTNLNPCSLYAFGPTYAFDLTKKTSFDCNLKQENLILSIAINTDRLNFHQVTIEAMRTALMATVREIVCRYGKCSACGQQFPTICRICRIEKCKHALHEICLNEALRDGLNQCPECFVEFSANDIIAY